MTGDVQVSRGTRRFALLLLVLVLIMGGGNLLATYLQVGSYKHQQAAQAAAERRAGEAVERKLCTTFGKLGERKPPAGSPGANPSRAYLQGQHATLDEIPADLGCPGTGAKP